MNIEELCNWIYANLINSALRFSNYNIHDAEDLLQDTCYKVVNSYWRYRDLPSDELKNISAKIMQNIVRDNLRMKKRHPHIATDDYRTQNPAVFIDYIQLMLAKKVAAFCLSRGTKQTLAVIMSAQGYSVKEIANSLNAGINTTLSYIHRGREKIIKEFES